MRLERLGGDPDWGRTKKVLKQQQKLLKDLLSIADERMRSDIEKAIKLLESGDKSYEEIRGELTEKYKPLREQFEKVESGQGQGSIQIGEQVTGVDSEGETLTGTVEKFIFGKPAIMVDGKPRVLSV